MALGKNKIEKEKDMKVILIGAGNLATHLGKAIFAAGHDVVQVFSRTMQSATALLPRWAHSLFRIYQMFAQMQICTSFR